MHDRPNALASTTCGRPRRSSSCASWRTTTTALYRRHPLAGWLHTPAGAERVTAQLDAARPLVAWLTKHVGPS